MSWRSRGKLRETQLKYKSGKVDYFRATRDLGKKYHVKTPIGIENSLDPVSATLWFLQTRNERTLCKDKVLIFDGFRLSELRFIKKNEVGLVVECIGNINRIAGFKPSENLKKPLYFKQYYRRKQNNIYEIDSFEIETFFGKLSFEKFNYLQ